MVLALLALLALFAVADTTPPDDIYGTWVNADTVTTSVEAMGADGPEVYTYTVLYDYLEVTDSTIVRTTVQEGSESDMTAYAHTDRYHVKDDLIVLEGDSIRLRLDLVGDTLMVNPVGATADVTPASYVRGPSPAVPPDLVGSWFGRVADRAGIAVDFRITFRPNGTMTFDGDVLRFKVAGPYFLLEDEGGLTFYEGKLIAMKVGRAEVDGDRLRLTGVSGDGDLAMIRMPSDRR